MAPSRRARTRRSLSRRLGRGSPLVARRMPPRSGHLEETRHILEIWATDSPSSERSGDEMTNPTPDTRTDAPGGRPDARTDASNDAGADARATASAHTGTPAPAERLLIVRLAGEFTIKSRRTQQTLRRTLVRNLRDALDSTGEPYELDAQFRHLVVRSGSER